MEELKATDKLLFDLNPDEVLLKNSIKEFGLTDDFREAGYILNNGKLLDLSGKREGGTPLMRSLDHRDICRALKSDGKSISGNNCMMFFERKNNLRFHMAGTAARKPSINVSLATYQDPNQKQLEKLRQSVNVCNRFGKCSLYWDIYDNKDDRCTSGYVDFSDSKDIRKVISDLNMCKAKEA